MKFKSLTKLIPHLITSGNLLCGCLAIIKVLQGDVLFGAYLVGLAAFLDFFDGFAARALGVSGEFGKQLDSLADCVTFGVVPGMVMMVLIEKSFLFMDISGLETQLNSNNAATVAFPKSIISYVALLIPIFSAIRLAKFNIDKRQNESFIGLPTPANSLFMLSIGYLVFDSSTPVEIKTMILKPELLISIVVLFSFLLVAELPLFALKFKNFAWEKNKIRYLFLILSGVLFVLLGVAGLPLVILLYILISLIHQFLFKNENSSS